MKSNAENILLNDFDKGLLVVENTNTNEKAVVKFKTIKSDEFKDYAYNDDEVHVKSKVVAINKNLGSECPIFFKDYNCVSVQSLTIQESTLRCLARTCCLHCPAKG